MEEFIIRVLGTLLKGVYLLPLLNFAILSRRQSKIIDNSAYKWLLAGLILGLINFIILMLINTFAFLGILNENTSTISTMMIYQTIPNVFLIGAYGLALIGMFKIARKDITSDNILSMFIYMVLIASITFFTGKSLLFNINITTYLIFIYLLISTFIETGLFLKKHIKHFYLIFMGILVLIADPINYIIGYNNLYVMFPNFTGFFYYRNIGYIIGSIGITFILVPNILFLNKLRKMIELKMNSNDTIVEHTIKKLLNETQKVYGAAVMNLFDNACESYYQEEKKFVDTSPELNLRNLDSIEQKKFFNKLMRIYFKIIPIELGEKILEKIADNRNSKLINDAIPDELIIPERIEPDEKILKTKRN